MKIPNLDLLIYQAQLILSANKSYQHFKDEYNQSHIFRLRPNFQADAFVQTWSDTSTGLGMPGGFSGQAMTDAYTVVVHELNSDMYVVFYDTEPAYIVDHPSKRFLDDLRNRNLLEKYKAEEAY